MPKIKNNFKAYESSLKKLMRFEKGWHGSTFCCPNTKDVVKTGTLGIHGHPGLYRESEDTLGCMRH